MTTPQSLTPDSLTSEPTSALPDPPPGWAARVLIVFVRGYQYLVRPLIGSHCRFSPHCSAYAIEALQRHGAWRGAILTAWRLLRCNPWHPGGPDPVPGHPLRRKGLSAH